MSIYTSVRMHAPTQSFALHFQAGKQSKGHIYNIHIRRKGSQTFAFTHTHIHHVKITEEIIRSSLTSDIFRSFWINIQLLKHDLYNAMFRMSN